MKSIVLVGIKNDQISVRLNEDATQEQILEAIKTQIITHVSLKKRVMHICHSFLFLGK